MRGGGGGGFEVGGGGGCGGPNVTVALQDSDPEGVVGLGLAWWA